ncbi:hypothetical protein PYS58_03815 [Chryseobacterium indologenes]|uniref:hypothetical protein n=1 Tax=Chryseobacterium TaxID=59732 RepID=UPI00162743CC|nr:MULTISPECIES: hypothetical protein [Chryseobacterium]MDM1554903.1 hypothetical protein [Chryseobacterium indologenes]WET50261.1 hypothetical protein PYS58_03815 [Chryseobacterium indologenes]
MNKEIIKKLNVLGGNTDDISADKTFAENWQGIKFDCHLYDKDWDVYGIDSFYEAHKDWYQTDRKKFYKNLLEHYFSDHELPYGQYFFRNWMFTPFKENTDDYEELDGLVEENEIREVVEGAEMEFICLFYSYGYPDHYFVCTTDPDPSNPIVYSTDHEVYFQEIENEGRLEKFLDRFMTQEEFREIVTEYLEGKVGK